MKIGELATAAQCTVETIRYYEKELLLPKAERTGGNYRLYDLHHLERLRFIRNCRALDMSHEEVRLLLRQMDKAAADCQPVNDLIDEHIGHVEERIAELRQLKEQLKNLRQQCRSKKTTRKCGILRRLSTMKARTKPTRTHHLH